MNVFSLETIHFQHQLIKLCLSLNAEYTIDELLHEAKVMSCNELTELLCKLMDTDD